MKRTPVFTVLFVPMLLFMALTASADPRMEINDNFCHCILDPVDTDNEVFIADCMPYITVEKNQKNIETEKNAEEEGSSELDGSSVNAQFF